MFIRKSSSAEVLEGKLQPKNINYTHESTENKSPHTNKTKRRKTHTYHHHHHHQQPNNHLSLISLNINELNCSIKKNRLTKLSTLCCMQETQLNIKDRHYLSKGLWKIFQADEPKKQAHITIQISSKTGFKVKLIKIDGKWNFILLKEKNPPRWSFNSQIYAVNARTTNVHERNTTKVKITHWPSHINSGRLQYPILTKREVIQTKDKQRHTGT